MKQWFIVRVSGQITCIYLIQAETELKAKEMITLPGRTSVAWRPTWRTLRKLFGCEIPPRFHDTGMVCGPINFLRDGNHSCFWPDL